MSFRPIKELKGFEKVFLKAGETQQISFTIDEKAIAFYGIDGKKKAEAGDFHVWVGLDSTDEANSAAFAFQ